MWNLEINYLRQKFHRLSVSEGFSLVKLCPLAGRRLAARSRIREQKGLATAILAGPKPQLLSISHETRLQHQGVPE